MTPVELPQLACVMPRLELAAAQAYLDPLNAAMAKAEINTPARKAMFLAQLAHESNQLRSWEELPHRKVYAWCRLCRAKGPHPAGAQYEGRADLGNTQPGDGIMFKGRGPIQLTGRANYRAAGADLGLDLERSPALVAQPGPGFLVAGWFWTTRRLNELADRGDFERVTKRINGGLLGYEDRLRFLDLATKAFA